MKRKDECIACRRRACYQRVVSTDGKTYDEVSCHEHRDELFKDSDERAPGVRKHFITSTGKQKRGEVFTTPNVKVTGLPQPGDGSDTNAARCGRSG